MLFKEAVKVDDCDNTIDPNSPRSTDAQKVINLRNATFFQGGKKVKVKARTFSSSGSDEKNLSKLAIVRAYPLKVSIKFLSRTLLTKPQVFFFFVNEPSSKVPCPVHIDPELSVHLAIEAVDTQITKVS
ncbi:hypothetical protein ACH5RR_015534 [Cinchona calisaya]|uniref:Uncharacterized protein n=1 Tax=Cinchona calisaya TaxID=153742 RepID=A0ABD2ZWJ7_9GENT